METIKNVHLLQILEGIKKIENLKLGGVKTKVVLKNKKALIAAYEELIEVQKKLVDQYSYKEEGSEENKFTKENEDIVNKEWMEINLQDSGIVLVKMNSAELDQFSDLTLEQMEILDLMSE